MILAPKLDSTFIKDIAYDGVHTCTVTKKSALYGSLCLGWFSSWPIRPRPTNHILLMCFKWIWDVAPELTWFSLSQLGFGLWLVDILTFLSLLGMEESMDVDTIVMVKQIIEIYIFLISITSWLVWIWMLLRSIFVKYFFCLEPIGAYNSDGICRCVREVRKLEAGGEHS